MTSEKNISMSKSDRFSRDAKSYSSEHGVPLSVAKRILRNNTDSVGANTTSKNQLFTFSVNGSRYIGGYDPHTHNQLWGYDVGCKEDASEQFALCEVSNMSMIDIDHELEKFAKDFDAVLPWCPGVNRETGNTVTMSMNNSAPNIMISGGTGTGKSALLHKIISRWNVMYNDDELHLWMIDPKFSLQSFEELPKTKRFVDNRISQSENSTMDELFLDVLRDAIIILNDRNSSLRSGHFVSAPRIVIVIETVEFISTMSYEDTREAEFHIGRISREGRSAGVHIVCTGVNKSKGIATLTQYFTTVEMLGLGLGSVLHSQGDIPFVMET